MSLRVLVAGFLFFLFPKLLFSQCWPEADKLVPDKGINVSEGLGKSIDIENDIAVVGAPDSDTLDTGSGVVYVFQFQGNTWKKNCFAYT